jgi:hypothetical protein
MWRTCLNSTCSTGAHAHEGNKNEKAGMELAVQPGRQAGWALVSAMLAFVFMNLK